MALLVGHRTCDLQVAGSSPVGGSLRSGLGQATYTHVSLSPSSIIMVLAREDDLFGWESNCGPGGK